MENSLVKLEKAERLLAEAHTLDDLRQIRDIAVAAQSYAKAAHLGMESQNRAAEVRLLAERRAGEMLAEMKRTGQRHNGRGNNQKLVGKNFPPKLADLGVKPEESKKWQSLAELPETEFRQALNEAGQERITDATLQRAVKAHRQAKKKEQKQNDLAAKAESFTAESAAPAPGLEIFNKDARALSAFVSHDVDLVFTSPPYNVGKAYQTHDDGLSDIRYRALLIDVFEECFAVMRDGARIGVNVPFGVERDPYIPFVPRVFEVLVECGFTLIGQTVWDKGQAAIAGSTAWGSYNSPAAPRFRDRCEAIVWAYKGSPTLEIPKDTSPLIDGDTFRTLAQDYWHVPPASSPYHPAVFPQALAENAIRFFGYAGCHVLDPFMGLGATLAAAQALGCRSTGIDIDKAYCALARERLAI